MKRRCVIDKAIGETRAAVWEGKALSELYTRRWSEANKPRLGDVFSGRVRKIEKSLGAAFIDLGEGPDGFLKFTTAAGAPRLTEGLRVDVEISREAEAEKGPNVKFIALAPNSSTGKKSGQSLQEFIAARFPDIPFEEASVGTLLNAVETELAIPGGGTLTIERTKAMTAIDIDSGQAQSPFSVAIAACPLIARQLRLRSIGGLIAIDFPNLRQRKQREDIMDELGSAFGGDLSPVKFAPLSRFGVVEMTRGRTGPSLDEILTQRNGNWTTETTALENLRQLQREGRAMPGAKLIMTVTPAVYDWLKSDIIDWEKPLTHILGARFEIAAGPQFSVAGDRK